MRQPRPNLSSESVLPQICPETSSLHSQEDAAIAELVLYVCQDVALFIIYYRQKLQNENLSIGQICFLRAGITFYDALNVIFPIL